MAKHTPTAVGCSPALQSKLLNPALGQRAGMVVKLAQPKLVIERIEGIVRSEAFQSLEDWIRENPFTPAAPELGEATSAATGQLADDGPDHGATDT